MSNEIESKKALAEYAREVKAWKHADMKTEFPKFIDAMEAQKRWLRTLTREERQRYYQNFKKETEEWERKATRQRA